MITSYNLCDSENKLAIPIDSNILNYLRLIHVYSLYIGFFMHDVFTVCLNKDDDDDDDDDD